MSVLEVNYTELPLLIGRLAVLVDFKKDLPMNVFVEGGFSFWFFERPLLCFLDLFHGLVSESVSSFGKDVYVKFSGGEILPGSCFFR